VPGCDTYLPLPSWKCPFPPPAIIALLSAVLRKVSEHTDNISIPSAFSRGTFCVSGKSRGLTRARNLVWSFSLVAYHTTRCLCRRSGVLRDYYYYYYPVRLLACSRLNGPLAVSTLMRVAAYCVAGRRGNDYYLGPRVTCMYLPGHYFMLCCMLSAVLWGD